jgi:glutamate--cysteine ligase
VHELARRMLEIATQGLRKRALLDAAGSSEDGFLQPLWELVDRHETRAEELLRHYRGEWQGDLCKLFESYNFI